MRSRLTRSEPLESGVYIETALSDGGRSVAFAVDGRGRKLASAVIPSPELETAIVGALEYVLSLYPSSLPPKLRLERP